MRIKFLYSLFFIASVVASAQITTTRMDQLKIGMSSNEVLKLLGSKPAAIADDTEFKLKQKGIEYTVVVGEGYLSGEEGKSYLKSVGTTSKLIKTISGLGVGSSIEDLWKAYSEKYKIQLNKATGNFREFTIEDEQNGTLLQFHLQNAIVTKIEIVSYNPEECFL